MSDEKQISELVKASLEARIIEAFRSTPEMIDELVRACLSREVTESGGKPDYHDRVKMPYLTFLARQSIEKIARETVWAYLETMKPVIQQQVQEKLSAGDVADAITASLLRATKNEYDVNVTFSAKKD